MVFLHPAIDVFATAGAGHFAIEKHDIEALLLQPLHGLIAGGGNDHLQAGGRQNLALIVEHDLFVIHQQHAAFELRFAAGHNSFDFSQRPFAGRHW